MATPDSRREAAINMLEKLHEFRMEHTLAFVRTPFDYDASLEAARKYTMQLNTILELMGIDS